MERRIIKNKNIESFRDMFLCDLFCLPVSEKILYKKILNVMNAVAKCCENAKEHPITAVHRVFCNENLFVAVINNQILLKSYIKCVYDNIDIDLLSEEIIDESLPFYIFKNLSILSHLFEASQLDYIAFLDFLNSSYAWEFFACEGKEFGTKNSYRWVPFLLDIFVKQAEDNGFVYTGIRDLSAYKRYTNSVVKRIYNWHPTSDELDEKSDYVTGWENVLC